MLSTRGGGYVDGAVLTVDGGRTLVSDPLQDLSLPLLMATQAAGTNDGIRLPADQYTYV